jgi:hypothetical protein
MLDSEGGGFHGGAEAAILVWKPEAGCVTTRGNRGWRSGGFREALPVICAQSCLIDTIGKELENLSF